METQNYVCACVCVIGRSILKKKKKTQRSDQWRGESVRGRDCGLESYKNETVRKIRYEEVCAYIPDNKPTLYKSPNRRCKRFMYFTKYRRPFHRVCRAAQHIYYYSFPPPPPPVVPRSPVPARFTFDVDDCYCRVRFGHAVLRHAVYGKTDLRPRQRRAGVDFLRVTIL